MFELERKFEDYCNAYGLKYVQGIRNLCEMGLYNLEVNSNPVDINNNHSKHSNKTSNKSSIHPLQTNSSVNLDQSSLSKVIKQH